MLICPYFDVENDLTVPKLKIMTLVSDFKSFLLLLTYWHIYVLWFNCQFRIMTENPMIFFLFLIRGRQRETNKRAILPSVVLRYKSVVNRKSTKSMTLVVRRKLTWFSSMGVKSTLNYSGIFVSKLRAPGLNIFFLVKNASVVNTE